MDGRRWPQAATCEILREHIADSAVVDRRVGTVNVNASLYHMVIKDSTFILFISILADRLILTVFTVMLEHFICILCYGM